MGLPKDYNRKDAQDILRYAKWLTGKTFNDVLEEDLRESQNVLLYRDMRQSLNPQVCCLWNQAQLMEIPTAKAD